MWLKTRVEPGPLKEAPVKEYQKTRGLKVDGIVGTQTFAQLQLEAQAAIVATIIFVALFVVSLMI